MNSKAHRKYLQRTRTLRAIKAQPTPKPGSSALANVRNVQVAKSTPRLAHPSRVLSKLINQRGPNDDVTMRYEFELHHTHRRSAVAASTR